MERVERNILVYVQDITRLASAIDLSLGYYGYAVHFATSLDEVCETLRRHYVERVITDLSMISADRCSLLKRVNQLSPTATVMILTDDDELDIVHGDDRLMPGYFLVGPGFMEAAHIQ